MVVCDADTGEIVRSASSPHPDGTEVDPQLWWSALQAAIGAAGGLDDVAAVSVGAQQHGMVCLDGAGVVVRDALLWNDTRSSAAAAELVDELGGPGEWAKRIGVVPVAAITATKLRWLADHEPAHADATAAVCLPHDWLTWRLSGSTDIADAAHRPQRRQRHRLLLVGGRQLPARPARAGDAGATAGAAHRAGSEGPGGADAGGRGARSRCGRQRRGSAGPWCRHRATALSRSAHPVW